MAEIIVLTGLIIILIAGKLYRAVQRRKRNELIEFMFRSMIK